MICPKCGYQRTEKDDKFTSQEECPKCGLIYARYKESRLEPKANPIEETIQEILMTMRQKRNLLNSFPGLSHFVQS